MKALLGWAFNPLPDEEREEVLTSLRDQSQPNRDYFILVVLSSIICTYGLLIDSVAVIIGGMLVAPLMTPILSMSLSMTRGSVYYFRQSSTAELKGVLLSIAIATFLTLIVPGFEVTSEVLTRTKPTLLDLIIALASGAAAAYAIAKKSVNAALPGVAIAVALLPPLCVVGIGLAARAPAIYGGGLLLFVANLLAIIVASSLVFWGLGFEPITKKKEESTKANLHKAIGLLVIVSLPMIWFFYSAFIESSIETQIQASLNNQIVVVPGAELEDFEYSETSQGLLIKAIVRSPKEYTQEQVTGMRNALQAQLRKNVNLRLETIVVQELNAQGT